MSEPALPSHIQADADRRLTRLTQRIDALRERMRGEVEAGLNDYLGKQRPETAEAKQAVAERVGGVLGRLGLAIDHCGVPSYLYVTSGKKDSKGRFRIVQKASRVPAVLTANLADLLPLKLIDAYAPTLPPVERSADGQPAAWADRIKDVGPPGFGTPE